jgi:hypothetical protein
MNLFILHTRINYIVDTKSWVQYQRVNYLRFYQSKYDLENFLLNVERKMNINLDSIAQYLEFTNKQQFFIVTPTVYGKHYKPIEGFL